MDCFSWVNTILGNLKTAIAERTMLLTSKSTPIDILVSTNIVFNRRFDLSSILPRLIFAAANTGSHPERWLRLAEDQC